MKWADYKVTVRLIAAPGAEPQAESKVTVRAVSKADALWRAINRRLDARYEALSAEKVE